MYKHFLILKKIDWFLFLCIFLLMSFGLAAIYSITLSAGEINFFSLQKQIFGIIAGLIIFFALIFIDYKFFKTYSNILYVLSAFLLLAVLFFGQTLRGTTGWFIIKGFGFQPVELAKLFLIIFLSAYFSRFGKFSLGYKEIIISGLSAGILAVMVILQPDFGSAMILFFIWLGLLLVRGIKKRFLLILVLLLIALSIISWFFVLQDYQKTRLLTFVNPNLDPLGSGYNITQATIAVGSGGFWGRGLGFGSQSQLKFLPASQTDFIFAVIAEELGLVGVILILGLWLIFFWRLIKAAARARDDFSLFFILGSIILFFSQITINIGMNLGIMPVTGITLPFISSGSSSLVSSFAVLGIAESIIARS